jgi:hypothetical protein
MKTKEDFLTITGIPEEVVINYLSRSNRVIENLWCKCGTHKEEWLEILFIV